MALPLGWEYFCFRLQPTARDLPQHRDHPEFTVSFPALTGSSRRAWRRERGSRIIQADTRGASHLSRTHGRRRSCRGMHAPPRVCARASHRRLRSNSLVVGRVVAASPRAIHSVVQDGRRGSIARLSPLVYLAPGRFGVVRETYSFPFPIDFAGSRWISRGHRCCSPGSTSVSRRWRAARAARRAESPSLDAPPSREPFSALAEELAGVGFRRPAGRGRWRWRSSLRRPRARERRRRFSS